MMRRPFSCVQLFCYLYRTLLPGFQEFFVFRQSARRHFYLCIFVDSPEGVSPNLLGYLRRVHPDRLQRRCLVKCLCSDLLYTFSDCDTFQLLTSHECIFTNGCHVVANGCLDRFLTILERIVRYACHFILKRNI